MILRAYANQQNNCDQITSEKRLSSQPSAEEFPAHLSQTAAGCYILLHVVCNCVTCVVDYVAH